MADFYQWDPTLLSVSVGEMDQEHITLIRKMNAVYAAHAAGRQREELDKLLQDFAGYTTQHFSDEEKYMDKVKFEGLATHKLIHQQLLKEVTVYLDEFKQKGELSKKFFDFLAVWLTSHIRGIDIKYGKKKSA